MKRIHSQKINLIVTLLLLLFSYGCEKLQEDYNLPQYENSVKIGVVGDVSALREQVENMFFGAKLASEEINEYGGFTMQEKNFEIELVFRNSAGSSEIGTDVTNELISDNIDLIIGPTFSSVAIEMAEVCIENQALMMTYAATTPELTFLNDNDLVWRTCPSDNTMGNISAQFSYDSLQARKAAILYRDDRFGKGLSEIIKNQFMEYGGFVTSSVSYPGEIVDLATYNFSYELNTLLREPVDIIFLVSFTSEVAVLSNAIYNNSLYQNFEKKPFLFVNDGIIAEELLLNGNPQMLPTIIGITSTNEGNPNYKIFKENFIKRFGFAPATYSEQAYDAVYSIAYAMLRANSADPNNIKNYLREISGTNQFGDLIGADQIIINVDEFNIAKSIIEKGQLINYEGASGPINFDQNGDPLPKITIWGIRNNEFTELSYYGK